MGSASFKTVCWYDLDISEDGRWANRPLNVVFLKIDVIECCIGRSS